MSSEREFLKVGGERLRVLLISMIQMHYEELQVPWGGWIVFVGMVCAILM